MLRHDGSMTPTMEIVRRPEVAVLWNSLRDEARNAALRESTLAWAMELAVLQHASFGAAMSARLAAKLAGAELPHADLLDVIHAAYSDQPALLVAACADLAAVRDRDPSNDEILTPFLYFKGFLALQGHRIAHWLWTHDRRHLARHIQSRCSEVLSIDIHPAAAMGCGIMLDHGNGLVIGETAVVEDDVSILQNVTLGGTGKETGDRHPKIRRGVLIGAGAKILGNIEIGAFSKVAAGSVVVKPVPAHCTVAGVPAAVVRIHSASEIPAESMDQNI